MPAQGGACRSDLTGPGGADGEPEHRGIPPRFRRAFDGRAPEVARARQFVAASLTGCPAAPDAVLLTSELATNAIRHSASGRGGSFTVAIAHGPGRVRVTITDDGAPTRPAVAPATADLALGGRGLLLVDVLAARWGQLSDGTYAAVWFELPCA